MVFFLTNVLTGVLNSEDPAHDDFELWSPSEERSEVCLFGRQVRDLRGTVQGFID
jgi:hypothetical protein